MVHAVVNKDQKTYPPETGLNEAGYNNNTAGWNYTKPVVSVFPKDTIVMRKAGFPLYYQLNAFRPTEILWQNDNAYTLSCYNCPGPRAVMKDSAFVGVQLTNQYGCVLKDRQYVRIYPPDFTVNLMESVCFDNAHTLVKFRICTSNGYDSIHAKMPVSFYNGDPSNENTKLLPPVYYTPVTAGVCQDFTYVIAAPYSDEITAVVNRRNDFVINETNYANNISRVDYTPFKVSLNVSSVTLPRTGTVVFHAEIQGGTASAYRWNPVSGLSCSSCASPVAAFVTSSMKYTVEATNQYYCTDTASVQVLTYTGAGITIPTAFTPNGDGQNDWFYIIGNSDIKMVRNFSIYNRVGNKVFEVNNTPANDRSYGWDGMVKGEMAGMGAYVYFATVEYIDGKTAMVKGAITLIR